MLTFYGGGGVGGGGGGEGGEGVLLVLLTDMCVSAGCEYMEKRRDKYSQKDRIYASDFPDS